MDALRALGLEQAVAPCAHVVPEALTLAPGGRPLARMPLARIEQRFGHLVSVDRGELLSALAAGIRDLIEFATPTSVRDGRLWAGGEHVEADLVVGADGIGSVTRELVAGAVRSRPAGYAAWRGIAATGAITPHAASETMGRGKRFGLVPLQGQRTYWFAVISGDDGSVDLASEFAGWHEPVAAVLAATPPSRRTFLPIADLPRLRRWHDGATVLVGDAAHAMTPNLGQGAAQSLVDVATLAECLRREPVPSALAAYAAKRKRRCERVVARSRAVGKLAQASNPVSVRLRDTVSRLTPEALLERQLAGVLKT
jgi:2-polyprenyl-6-methoxyphenol hydroxylase-like FAD-dependent oxidoreductase